jgi:hypothetical protein
MARLKFESVPLLTMTMSFYRRYDVGLQRLFTDYYGLILAYQTLGVPFIR